MKFVANRQSLKHMRSVQAAGKALSSVFHFFGIINDLPVNILRSLVNILWYHSLWRYLEECKFSMCLLGQGEKILATFNNSKNRHFIIADWILNFFQSQWKVTLLIRLHALNIYGDPGLLTRLKSELIRSIAKFSGKIARSATRWSAWYLLPYFIIMREIRPKWIIAVRNWLKILKPQLEALKEFKFFDAVT